MKGESSREDGRMKETKERERKKERKERRRSQQQRWNSGDGANERRETDRRR